MRSLEECKTEIFRRSEDRIKNRKKNIVGRVVISGISTAAAVLLIACAVRWISTISFVADKSGASGPQYNNGGPLYSSGNSVQEDKEPGAEEEVSMGDSNHETEQVVGSLTSVSIEYSAQFIRTNAAEEGEYPVIKIIRSVEELKTYYEDRKDTYHLVEFIEACAKYDEAYFEKQILVLVVLEEGSGSISHKVTNVGVMGIDETKMMTIEIDRIVPELLTCDMAQWHILIEPEAGITVEDEEDISVTLNRVQEKR